MSNTAQRRASTDRREGPTRPQANERRESQSDRRAEENRLLVTFYIGGQHLCVDVLRVQEIIQPQQMTPIPTAEPHFAGLINLRGQIVTAIDLRLLLGFEALEDRSECMNLVVKVESGSISLLFDKIGDVIEVARHNIETPPGTLDPKMREFVKQVIKMDRDLLLFIDVEAVAAV